MSTQDEIEDSSAPLIEHLAELRTRLIRSVIAFLLAMILCFAFGERILQFVLQPIEDTMRALGDPNPQMIYTAPQEFFFTLIRVSVVGGLLVAFPVIAHQLWRFVAPGLYKKEKKAFLPFMIASPMLFTLGAAFAHYVVVPLAMQFFIGFADFPAAVAEVLTPEVPGGSDLLPGAGNGLGAALPPVNDEIGFVFTGKVNESLDITLKMIVAFGLCFQLPVLLTLMGVAGLVSKEGLGRMRKYAVVGILLLAALVTPPDVVTQIILFVVVYGLYELSIQLVGIVERRRIKQLREDGVLEEDEEL